MFSTKTTQAQLDIHNMTSQVTQEQIDLQTQLEIHTTNLLTNPLSNDSPVFFLGKKEPTSTSLNDPMEHQPIPQKMYINLYLRKKNTFRY